MADQPKGNYLYPMSDERAKELKDKANYLLNTYYKNYLEAVSSGFGGPEYRDAQLLHMAALDVYVRYLEGGEL